MPDPDRHPVEAQEIPQAPTPDVGSDDPFSSMMRRFDEAATLLGLSPDAYMVLRKPDREYKFAIPIRNHDGEIQVYHGFRIRHNLSLGPCLGGLRLDDQLRREELRALAAWTTWKCAALNVPFGGAMGGVNFNPRTSDAHTTQAVVRRYTSGLLDLIGPEQDILSPDLHCDEQIMAWCLDTYSMHVRHTENAVVVGKPLGLGGTLGRDYAVGRCARVLMEEQLKIMGIPGPARVVVQGAGNIGSQVMRELHARGHKVIAIGDLRGAITNADGLDVEAVLAHRKETGSVVDAPGSQQLPSENLLALECDVLIPAAVSRQITGKNADTLATRLVLEAANGPTTAKADAILEKRGIPVIPDLLGNAGSVIIAYFEWVQNRMGYHWIEPIVKQRLDRMIADAFQRARKRAEEKEIGLRLATCMLGVERVAYYDKLRGTYA